MAEKRMFTKKITNSDSFTAMPPTAQCLYFHLCMNADDDGFSNNVRGALFNAHASTDDFNTLVSKRFIIPFESGVIVIKHWKMHNYIQNDRYHETEYVEERARLVLKENGAYTEVDTTCIQNVSNMDTECIQNVSRDKNSIDKSSIEELSTDKYIVEKRSKRKDPDEEKYVEIIDYLNLKTGSNYRYSTKSIREYINGRLREGYTVDDFKTVIDKKCLEWEGTDQEQYLRPSTLFAPKHFAEYLNQPVKKAKKSGFGFADIDWSTI